MSATFDEILIDCWAHAHADNPKLHEEIVDDDFDAEVDAMEARAAQGAHARQGDPAPDSAPPTEGLPEEDWETIIEDRY